MNILILEDETPAGKKIAGMLQEIDPKLTVLTILKSVEAAKGWFDTNDHPDLVISDIRLLDGLSFELFEAVDYCNPVIFTTAYDRYAIKAFEVNSIDYLLKPVQKEKLEKALEKVTVRSVLHRQPAYDDILAIMQAQHKEYKARFMIRAGQKILAVPADKVAYFRSINKLTYIITHDGKKYPCDQTLEMIDGELDPKRFFRVNRKYIVNFDAIGTIHPYFKGRIKIDLVPETDDDIVISSDRTPEFKKWLDQ